MNKQLIIHATSSIKALKGILSSLSLRLSYSKEDFCIGSKKISSAAHPMVCFCEHDVNELQSKTITYGRYGIAFSTNWALKKRISPVLYIDVNSLAAKGLATLLKARQNKENFKDLPKHLRLPIMEIKCFTKNIRGYNSKLKKDFVFKNENEWRYVPRKSDIGGNLISQNQRTYLRNQDFHNKKLLPYPLKFKISDIEVIFVAKKDEAMQLSKEFPIDLKKIQVSKWKT